MDARVITNNEEQSKETPISFDPAAFSRFEIKNSSSIVSGSRTPRFAGLSSPEHDLASKEDE